MALLEGDPPLLTEESTSWRKTMAGNDRHKERAALDVLLDLESPSIAAFQLTAIKPCVESRLPQLRIDTPDDVPVLAA